MPFKSVENSKYLYTRSRAVYLLRCCAKGSSSTPTKRAPLFGHFFNSHFYSPPRFVRGFALFSNLLDKPWSQVSSRLSPGTCLHFLARIGFSIPTCQLPCSSSFIGYLLTHPLAPSARHFSTQEKAPTSTSMDSGRNLIRTIDFRRHDDHLPVHRGRLLESMRSNLWLSSGH